MVVISVYRSTSGNFACFLEVMEQLLERVGVKSRIILCGDFNINFDKAQHNRSCFLELLSTYDLRQTVTAPTRGTNCIDNIFINFSTDNYCTDNVEPFLSDHRCQILKVPVESVEMIPKYSIGRPITERGKFHFYNVISEVNFDFVYDESLAIEKRFELFMGVLSDAYLGAFPERILRFRGQQPLAWFNEELKKMREHLKFLSEVCIHHNTPNNRLLRNNYRSQYREALKKAKISSNDSLIKNSNSPGKTAWSIINSHKRTEQGETTVLLSQIFLIVSSLTLLAVSPGTSFQLILILWNAASMLLPR